MGARKTIIIGSVDVRADSLWRQDGGVYIYTQLIDVQKSNFGGEAGYERADYSLDVIADNVPLRHVVSADALLKSDAPAFYYNPITRELSINFIPSDFESLELTRCDRGFKADRLTGITIADMSLQNFANPAQQGVLDFDFCSAYIENVEVRFGHGVGVKVGSKSVVRQSWLNDNGQQGVNVVGESNAYTTDVTIDSCRIERNNFAHFKRGNEAGNKFTFTERLTVKRCYVKGNYGMALWADGGNLDYLIQNNTIVDNDSAGVYVEISRGGEVVENFLARNAINRRGEAEDKQARLGQIWIDTSAGNQEMPISITDNTFTGDCLHVALRNGNRPNYTLQRVTTSNNLFYGGAIAVNDIYTNNLSDRYLVFDSNRYTPDMPVWVGGKPMAIDTLDSNASMVSTSPPLDPPYTVLPDLDAVVIPDPKPLPPTRYKIDAVISIFGHEVGKIEGVITEVDNNG